MIENLFDNAVSFSPEGASIGVRLEAQDGMAELLDRRRRPGRAAGELDAHLRPLFLAARSAATAPASEAGHFGIGLWIARRNVEALGGTITAENRSPHGLADAGAAAARRIGAARRTLRVTQH